MTQQRLKVAVLNRLFRPTAGGAERYSIALVEHLAAQHDLHVFAQQIEHHDPRISYHRIFEPFTKPRWLNQLWFACATWWHTRKGFDVVHSHENTWHGQVQSVHVLPIRHTLFAGRSGWRLGLRWLKVVTSPRLLTYLLLEHFRYRAQPGRCVVAASGNLAAVMRQTYPAAAPYLSVITPGVAQLEPIADAQTQASARAQLGLPQQGFGLVFVANDFRKKGLPALLQALSKLEQQVWLAVLGNTGQIGQVQAELDGLGVAQRVHFLGQLPSPDAAYTAADCLVHPTLEDAFGMVVLEAMAHSLPVVVSDQTYCGIAALLQHEVNALLLKNPHDADQLTRALQRVVGDASFRQSLRAAGRAFAAQHLWALSAQAQDAAYRQAASASVR